MHKGTYQNYFIHFSYHPNHQTSISEFEMRFLVCAAF